jgi:hypothetical protein
MVQCARTEIAWGSCAGDRGCSRKRGCDEYSGFESAASGDCSVGPRVARSGNRAASRRRLRAFSLRGRYWTSTIQPEIVQSFNSATPGLQGMVQRLIRVRFVNPVEIRMGSPYCACRVHLSGAWVPDLPNAGDGFQNLRAWSPDGRHLGLVQWEIRKNDPGFRIVIIAVRQRRVLISPRVAGCCESLKWDGRGFKYQALVIRKGQIAVTRASRDVRCH